MAESDAPASRIHFPGLNGLRFLAAFAVVLYHVEGFKAKAGIANWSTQPFWTTLGPYGVVCFFTLSGFLITYLLLEESRRTSTIRIGRFYLRRILRIWPLYYLIVVLGALCGYLFAESLGFGEIMKPPLSGKLFFFVFFLPNLAWMSFGTFPFLGPLWSIGVEEQFYLIWPALLRVLRGHALLAITLVLALVLGARFVLPWLALRAADGANVSTGWQLAIAFLWTLKLECMAAGGLAAWLLHQGPERLLRALYHPLAQAVALSFVLVCLAGAANFGRLDNLVWGAAFAIVILNVAANPGSIVQLRARWLDELGRISFGIYLYHCFVIPGCMVLARRLLGEGLVFNLVLYPAAIGLTLLVAKLSYELYERRFLRFKHRFTIVESQSSSYARSES